MTHEAIAAFIIDTFEAGYPPGRFTDHPDDLGGPTRWGVTKRGLAAFRLVRPADITTAQIRALTWSDAVEICVELAIRRPGLAHIAAWEPLLVTADFTYHAGADDGVPALQRAARAVPDGVFGPQSLAKVNGAPDPVRLAVRAVGFRQRVHWARAQGRQLHNLRGWLDRCTTLLLTVTP